MSKKAIFGSSAAGRRVVFFSGTVTYALLTGRARLEREAEWVLKVLGRFLPGRLKNRPLLIFALWKLTVFAFETTVLGAALFGLLQVATPLTTLSLFFLVIFAAGIAEGYRTVRRTVQPPDAERLLMAPISDRRAYALVWIGGGAVGFGDNLLVLPVVAGGAISIVFGSTISWPLLWGVVLGTVLFGLLTAFVADRVFGALWIRRARRGVRGGSLVSYALFSAIAFGVGLLLARAMAPWFSAAPWARMLTAEELFLPNDSGRWLLSFPAYALDAVAPLAEIVAHPLFLPGAAARVVTGEVGQLPVVCLWGASAALAAIVLRGGSGAWYRSEWQGGWQAWARGDLFDRAEKLFSRAARVLYPADHLLAVQIRNLCRRREWVGAGAFDLFGGSFGWMWVGLAAGTAPILTGPAGAAIFALVVGGWLASEASRAPFVNFMETLVVDAEGRQAGMYRVAGKSVLELYRAKLRAGNIVAGPPILATLVLVGALAGLPAPSWILLGLSAFASWVVGSYGELLPSLASPHFGWDHPDELGTYFEQRKLSSGIGRAPGLVLLVQLVLVALFLKGWIVPGLFVWVAAAIMALTGVVAWAVFHHLSRQAAKLTDRMDFPA